MMRLPRFALFASLVTILSCLTQLAPPALAKELRGYDALDGQRRQLAPPPGAGEQALLRAGAPVHFDDRLSLPTFLWAVPRPGPSTAPARGIAREEQAARYHLEEFASLYRLSGDDVSTAHVSSIHNTGKGAVIVAFQRRVGGVEVFRDELKVIMGQELGLVALSGYLPGGGAAGRPTFALGPEEALASALRDYLGPGGPFVAATDFARAGGRRGEHEHFNLATQAASTLGIAMPEAARVRRVLFHLPDALEPAYHLEINVGQPGSVESDFYGYVISAKDGRLLFRKDLTESDSFSYRVWAESSLPFVPFDGPQGSAGTPHPTGVPDGFQAPFTAPSLVTLQNGPISTSDPWLPPGATVTNGNNADAYADIDGIDGFSGTDLRATTTSPNTFDRTYDTALSPSSSANQRMAAVTQLFFDVNFLHDWFYDAGFNEISRNAQADNYGRGGLQGDHMRAEAQDFDGRNNADMTTPSDGGRPRMQMFVWDGIGHCALTVNAPAGIAGDYAVGTAVFGPTTFNTTATVVMAEDGTAPGSDACTTPFVNAAAIVGKIAFIDRGTCAFTVKVKNAQLNGAIGAIVANNVGTGFLNMGGTDATITIPSLFVSQADGNLIRAQIGAGVSASLVRDPALERDGTIDNQIVAHEWGHYISHRLVGNSAGLTNSQGRGMGEGWGDFHALLVTVRAADAAAPSNPNWSGAYAIAGYVFGGGSNGPLPNTGYYFGLRRYPYSTDFTRNPLTFRHIGNGVPLPGTAPLSSGADGSNNAEVHNTGEVWTSMLWECYAALLRDTQGSTPRLTFDQARDRMRNYLVAGYKATPNAPTFTEARDALLAAAAASDSADHLAFWKAFAKRGAGFGAVSPDRNSSANQGAIESFAPAVDLAFTGATLTDAVSYCDNDGVLDDGETGRLTITLRNAGSGSFSATTATITSANPGVSFPGGSMVSFPSVGPSGTTSASLDVALSGVTGIQSLDFDIAFTDPGFTIPGTVNASFSSRGNLDDVAGQTATDDFESSVPRWTISGNGSLSPLGPWRRVEGTAFEHYWHGPDAFATSDQYLISPVVNVAPTGSFSFTFRHRYFFEFTTSPSLTLFDGGVIEISTNGGLSWADVGSAAAGYNGTLVTGGNNPLEGRPAFAQISAGYPAFINATVNLGTTYQGQSVMIRFRIGSDVSGDDPGWDIDDVAFNNVTNLPFNALVADRALCVDSDTDGFIDRDDCQPFNPNLWSAPSEALGLDVIPPGGLTWSAPAQMGGTGLVYDVLRSQIASSFAAAACVESDGSDLTAADPDTPGIIYCYLVRSQNGCGDNLGADSAGTPRSGTSCP